MSIIYTQKFNLTNLLLPVNALRINGDIYKPVFFLNSLAKKCAFWLLRDVYNDYMTRMSVI